MTEDREYWEHHFKEHPPVKELKFLVPFVIVAAMTVGMFWILFLSGWAR